VTHEVGHFIGLDHTLDFDATMFAGYDEGTTELRTLEQDDIDGACAIYPPSRAATCDPDPKGGLAYECSDFVPPEESGCATSPRAPTREGAGGALACFSLLTWLSCAARRRLRRNRAAQGTNRS
jgi:hypothetical protein